MARSIALSVACLIAALVCVRNAIERDAFSLWDVGYYLAALGALLCLGRMFQKLHNG
jgi:hypothetical protein